MSRIESYLLKEISCYVLKSRTYKLKDWEWINMVGLDLKAG